MDFSIFLVYIHGNLLFAIFQYKTYHNHIYYPEHNSLTWTLDYNKTSDFDDVVGHWHIQELKPNKCRIYYSSNIKIKGYIPRLALNYISQTALKLATSWVQRDSEANPFKTIPIQYSE